MTANLWTHLSSRPCLSLVKRFSLTIGLLCSPGITPVHSYYKPLRHPLIINPLPSVYWLQSLSSQSNFLLRTSRASPVAWYVLVTMLSLSPRWNKTIVYRPVFDCLCCLRPLTAGSASRFFYLRGHLCVYFRYGLVTCSSSLKMTSLIGFRDLVTLLPAIQATGLLAFTLTGLSPAEHTSLSWTHKLVRNFTPWGSQAVRIGSKSSFLPTLYRPKIQ